MVSIKHKSGTSLDLGKVISKKKKIIFNKKIIIIKTSKGEIVFSQTDAAKLNIK